MDVNRDKREGINLEEELGSLFDGWKESAAKIREAAKKAAELAEFCGLSGIVAMKEWADNPENSSAELSCGVDLLARGRDLDSFSRKLADVAARVEGKEAGK